MLTEHCSETARNCPGGQQVFTPVLKAIADLERSTNMAIGHMVPDIMAGWHRRTSGIAEQSQRRYILVQDRDGQRCPQCHVLTHTSQNGDIACKENWRHNICRLSPDRSDVQTDTSGRLLALLPSMKSGLWSVQKAFMHHVINSSKMLDANCQHLS